MKKTIGIITGLIFAVCAFVIVPAGADAETYKVSDGKSLSFTNAPTTKAGSNTKVVTIKNDRKSLSKSSLSKAQNRTSKAGSTGKGSTQTKENVTEQNTQEKKQSEEMTTQNEDGDNGDTKIAITNAPI